MPIGGGPNNGSFPSVSAVPIVFAQTGGAFELIFGGAGSLPTQEVHADNLAGLNAWFLQTAGAGVVTVQIQFANGQAVGGVDWQPIVGAFNLVLGTPSLTNYRLGSRRYRALVTSTGAANVIYRLTGSIT